MARYLVTGVAGFIGARVAARLLESGNEVLGLDNLNDAYDVRLKRLRLNTLQGVRGFRFTLGDVRDAETVSDATALARVFDMPSLGPIEAVFNLAARAGIWPSLAIPGEYLRTNVEGTLNLLELCKKAGIARFILASSSSLYGDRNKVPFSEDDETDHALSPYAASKKAAEVLAYSYHHLYGVNVGTLRFFTVYGPAGRPDMSPLRFVRWIEEGKAVVINGDGTQSRDFTFVDDVAEGTVSALNVRGFEVINLGFGGPVTLLDLIREIERATGKKAKLDFRPVSPADMRATWAETTKAKTLLGWSAKTELAEGIDRTVQWYRENRAALQEMSWDEA